MSKSILIVDDNPNMSSLLAEMLEIFDYNSVIAKDGEDALEKMIDNKFSLIITDMRMPNMTGLELLEKVKELYAKIPVVLISGYTVDNSESDDKVKPDGFLSKPFLMSDIEELLNSLL
jgi:CheY-like chemotaxis protein